jgi:hypothetical protein
MKMTSGLLCCVDCQKFTYISEVLAASIIRTIMMEAASTSETSVNFYRIT